MGKKKGKGKKSSDGSKESTGQPSTSGIHEQPTQGPAPQPTQKPVSQPTQGPAPQPTQKPAPQPTQKPESQPTQKPAPQSTQKPESQPTQRSAPQSTQRPVPQPTQRPASPQPKQKQESQIPSDKQLFPPLQEQSQSSGKVSGRGRGEERGRGRGEWQGRGRGRGERQYRDRGRGYSPDTSVSEVQGRGSPVQQPFRSETELQQPTQSPRAEQEFPQLHQKSSSRTDGRGRGPKRSGRQDIQQDIGSITSQVKQITTEPSTSTPSAPARKEKSPESYQLAIPSRKQIGTKGRPIQVDTNHFALKINPKYETAIHYDVTINPDKPKRMMRLVWEEFKRRYLPKYAIAFDDVKNAYTPSPLPFDNVFGGEVEVGEDDRRPKTYTVEIKYAAEVNLRALFDYMQHATKRPVPQDALQCIDIVFRNTAATRFVKVGRSFFSKPEQGQIYSLGNGLELWYGYFQSTVLGWKPFLNVDVAHKGFPTPQPVSRLIQETQDIESISKFLKGLKIIYEIPQQPATRRTLRVNGLVGLPDESMFVDANNVRQSVTQYYERQKGYKIREKQLPCVWVGPRDGKVYLPAELCTIMAGQVYNKKMNERQTSSMVRKAATSTDDRKMKIMNAMAKTQYNSDPVIRAFGLEVNPQFERINARWLTPPTLAYAKNTVNPSKGTWRAESFLEPAKLEDHSWTIINLDRRTRDDSLINFTNLLKRNSSNLGMYIGNPEQPFVKMERFNQQQFEANLTRNKNKKLIFVVIPDYPTNIYSKVKQTAELNVGCLTQCIKSKTMYNMNPATIGNILLKVNAKLNGLNHTIAGISRPQCLTTPCMIMGADVTHPSPDQTDIPSVAAVTASFDPKAFRYLFTWRLQPAREEIIIDLEEIVREQLLHFYRQTNQKPQRIIFFRDGVSEGQFTMVMNRELMAIRKACSKLGDGTYRPYITFLVVQKRHHTRFFPSNPRESEDRNNNVRAGTVVDTDITHPTDIEYYLVSHASIQGVARPTKYRVLWDDSNFNQDDLQALTYYLCHMFTRCTRSVSYPAPTYYAHLAAFRARTYLDGKNVDLKNLEREQRITEIKPEILRGKSMFFV